MSMTMKQARSILLRPGRDTLLARSEPPKIFHTNEGGQREEDDDSTVSSWVRGHVEFQDQDWAALGRKLTRISGILYWQIFVPAEDGMDEMLSIGEELVFAYQNEPLASLSGIRLSSIRYREIGLVPQDVYYQSNFEAFFQYDQRLS